MYVFEGGLEALFIESILLIESALCNESVSLVEVKNNVSSCEINGAKSNPADFELYIKWSGSKNVSMLTSGESTLIPWLLTGKIPFWFSNRPDSNATNVPIPNRENATMKIFTGLVMIC